MQEISPKPAVMEMETQVQPELPTTPAPEELIAIGEKLRESPADIDLWIEKGQALRKVMNFRAEIDAYSQGLGYAPFSSKLYLHRGHAYINIRRYREGAADLELAARLDSNDWDIWYHLGLSYYLVGDFARAAKAYEGCFAVPNVRPGYFYGATDWYCLTLMRQNRLKEMRAAAARVLADMPGDDHHEYFNRVLVYNGSRTLDEVYQEATQKDDHHFATGVYGLAVYCERVLKDRTRAYEMLKEVRKRSTMWSGFAALGAYEQLKEYEGQ